MGLNMEVEQQVRALDMPMRVRMLSVLATKMQQTAIQSPSTYLAGIIRTENRAGPYQRGWSPGQAGPGASRTL